MPLTLDARLPLHQETARLFDEAAASIRSAADRGDARVVLTLEAGPPHGEPAALHERVERIGREAIAAMLGAADRMERSLRQLHRSGGSLTCVSRGAMGGPLFEIALMADRHLMARGSTLRLAGLFDDYVPCAGGWSRLVERAGPARAATLLLGGEPLSSERAISAGLCEGLAGDSAESEASPPRASRLALRLAAELADRATYGGGLTPRQARLLERASFALAFATGDPREGITAFFEGRDARFDAHDHGDQPHGGAHR